jgi:RNA polymerase sigma-70 factor (ECF subfamily)
VDDSTSLSLLEHVRQRSPEAWARLVFLYGPLVEHWCQSWGAPAADADDIKQEVFQAVSTAMATFRRDRPGDTFRGWLRVIARRKFLDYCRQKGKQGQAQGGTDAHRKLLQVPDPENVPADDPPDEVTRLHHRALELVRGQFEERTWQAFWRSAVDGQTPADVGQELGMTTVAVRKAKSRVLRRLKEEMGDLLG